MNANRTLIENLLVAQIPMIAVIHSMVGNFSGAGKREVREEAIIVAAAHEWPSMSLAVLMHAAKAKASTASAP